MKYLNRILQWIKRRRRPAEQAYFEEAPGRRENPYLPHIRQILEQVLHQRGLTYGRMRLMIVDAVSEPESFFEEDPVTVVLQCLSPDLNFLTILTERPAYFQDYVETMYEENGLLVSVAAKQNLKSSDANTVLDFERDGDYLQLGLSESCLYIPIYKKNWEQRENLDILVPIGYNTVIVKEIL